MKAPINIKRMAKDNKAFRHVIDTGKNAQVVLISLRKGEDLGEEIHPATDELYYVVDGEGEIRIDGKAYPFNEHSAMLVPAGMRHDVFNTGKDDLKLFAMFTSPLFKPDEVIMSREKSLAFGKR